MSKNKLRSEKNKKVYIYAYSIIFIIILMCGLYLAYMMIDFENATGDAVSIDVNILVNFFNYLGSPKLVTPINLKTTFACFKYQVTELWWLYASAVFLVFLVATSNTKDDFRGMEHGSAGWADKIVEKQFKDNTGIPVGLDTYVTIKNPKGDAYETHNLNEFVIGGSGAGKSFRKIKPDIMQMLGSYVVTDPKGELYRDCAKFLKENGYKVRVLNLININMSNTFNPFDYMTEEQDVLNVADLFMKNSAGEGEKEDFWSGAAQDMLVAIMVYLWKTPYELKNFGRVVRIVNSVKYKDGKIDPECEFARCMHRHECNYPNDVTTVNWGSIQGTPEETLGSICKTLSTRLRLWAVEDVDVLTAKDEMDFDHIGKEKTAVFLIIPAARQTYKVIANIFYSQLFERLMLVANNDHNGKLPVPVFCEMDEFANIGKVPNFNETLAVVRSYNIRICIVVQGLSQLKAMYEKTWDSIIGNCSIFTFLGTNDNDSKEYVSKKLGKTTVRVDTRSYNRGNQGGGSDNESLVQRDLLAHDEISQAIKPKGKTKKYGGSCIIFVDEHKPLFIPKYDTMHHSLFDVTGSSFPKGIPNNTDIRLTYGEIYEQHKNNHSQEITDFFEIDKQNQIEDTERLKQEQEEQDRKEQEELNKSIKKAENTAKSALGDVAEYKDIKDIPDDDDNTEDNSDEQKDMQKDAEQKARTAVNPLLSKIKDSAKSEQEQEEHQEQEPDEDDFENQSETDDFDDDYEIAEEDDFENQSETSDSDDFEIAEEDYD